MTESALSIMIMKDGHRMKLYEGNIGATYLVESVHVDEAINRRLEALLPRHGACSFPQLHSPFFR